MKKYFFIISTILFTTVPANADVFDNLKKDLDLNLIQAVDQDTRGYYYDTVSDNNFKPIPNDPELSSRTTASLGCSGFDFNSNFLNQFKLEALSGQLASLGKEVVAASPMLLLEYASPTLADLLKHFDSVIRMKLGMLYAQCEDIENAAGDKVTHLRKESERECIDKAQGMDMESTIKLCKQQSDPFGFIKDLKGAPLKDGGEINLIKDALDRVLAKDDDKEKMQKRIPNTIITSNGIETTNPEQNIEHVLADKRKEYFDKIADIYERFTMDPNSVSREDLDSISIPGVPITKSRLNDLVMLDKNDRLLKFAQISSSLARYTTIKEYETHREVLKKAINNAETKEFERTELNNDLVYIDESIKRVNEDQGLRDSHAEIIKDSIVEADRRRLRAMTELNTSDQYSKESNDTIRKNMLMISE